MRSKVFVFVVLFLGSLGAVAQAEELYKIWNRLNFDFYSSAFTVVSVPISKERMRETDPSKQYS